MYCESMAKNQETYDVAYSPMCFSLRSIIFKSSTTRSITLFDDELCFWGSVVAMAFCLVQAYTGRMLEHIELERRKESNVQMEIGEADVEEYSKNASLGDESKEKAGVLPSPQVTIQPPPQ
uniref:Copper transporter n=1 Tax=Steinernema glaseri TaxID=37863 RepID=A0A1I7Y5E9_9BILA